MALVKQNIPIAFGKGIDTKIDPKQQLLTTFRTAKNVIYETVFSIRKRNGYRRLQLQTVNGTLIDGAQKLSRFKDELIVFASNVLYGMTASTERQNAKGKLYSVFPTSYPVLNGASSHTTCDVSIVGSFECYAYSTASGQIRYSVRDATNNALLASNVLVGAGQQAKIVALAGFVYVIYANSTNISYRRFAVSSPETLEAPVAVANNLNSATPSYDVIAHNGKAYVAYNSSVVSARTRAVVINTDGTLGSGVGLSGSSNCSGLTLLGAASGSIVLACITSADLSYTILSDDLLTVELSSTVLETTANLQNVGILETSTNSFTFWYGVSGATLDAHQIGQVTANSAGTIVSAPSVFVRSLALLAKPYFYDSQVFVPAVFGPPVQSTNFILDSAAVAVAKWSVGGAGGFVQFGSLPKVVQIATDEFIVPSLYKTRTEADGTVFFSVFGVLGTKIEHAVENPLQNAELASNLHIAGGVLSAYDGDELAEHGFHMYPDAIAAGTTTPTGGNMSDGNYGYVALYRWTDNFGQDHRSAVSPGIDVTIGHATSTQTQQINVPSLRLTQKTEVVIELYRTEASGSIFYLTATVPNDASVDTVSIIDSNSDATLISKLPLYTTGGVLDNAPAPSAKLITTHTASSRLFAVSEQPNTLIYSKIALPGQPVEWNEALQYAVDPIGGPITALASMDEKLVIFKQDAILFISGSGPNNLGQQNTFTEPERVSVDVGCIEPESVVLMPAGLMFKSRKGIFLLGRGLQLQYIGAPVEAYNSLRISSAKIIPDANQVRFTTFDGDSLVFNYNLGLWSTYDNHQALGAEVVGNQYYYVRSSTELFAETPNQFSDNGSPISILLETGWMSFANLQGFQRVYKMLVLGDWKSTHLLRVRAAYDFNEAWTHEKVLNPVPGVVSGLTYGTSLNYGSGSPYGGDGDVYQARFDFAKQKCQSIKLQFTDLQSASGEGIALSAFTVEVGGKNGLFKARQSKISGVA